MMQHCILTYRVKCPRDVELTSKKKNNLNYICCSQSLYAIEKIG